MLDPVDDREPHVAVLRRHDVGDRGLGAPHKTPPTWVCIVIGLKSWVISTAPEPGKVDHPSPAGDDDAAAAATSAATAANTPCMYSPCCPPDDIGGHARDPR